MSGKGYGVRPPGLGKWWLAAQGIALFYVMMAVIIPTRALIHTASTQVLSISIWAFFENANWGVASALSLGAIPDANQLRGTDCTAPCASGCIWEDASNIWSRWRWPRIC